MSAKFYSKIQLKKISLIISILLCFNSFSQRDHSDTTHYILDASSSPQFFIEVYNSIDTVERVFISTCFYYVELFKENRIFVDTFDLLSSENYDLLKSILAKNENLYGYSKSTYFIKYFKDHTDSLTIIKMNKVLDSIDFGSAYYNDRKKGLYRLHGEIKEKDTSVIYNFLDFLPDSIKKDEISYNLNKGMLLYYYSFWKHWYGSLNSTRSDLIVNYDFYSSLLYGGDLKYLRNQNLGRNVIYHINLRENNTINHRKLKRNIRKAFDLKAKNMRKGGKFGLPNGQIVRVYN